MGGLGVSKAAGSVGAVVVLTVAVASADFVGAAGGLGMATVAVDPAESSAVAFAGAAATVIAFAAVSLVAFGAGMTWASAFVRY